MALSRKGLLASTRIRWQWHLRLLPAAFLFLMSVPLSAQTGRIAGRIADPSGAPILNATVTLSQSGTNQERTSLTGTEGYYDISNLLAGEYSIKVDAKGFRPLTQTGVQLQVAQNLGLDLPCRSGP